MRRRSSPRRDPRGSRAAGRDEDFDYVYWLSDPGEFPRLQFRPLPRPLPPHPDETLDSYLERLRRANCVPYKDFAKGLQIGHGDKRLAALSELTGRTPEALRFALPELRHRRWSGYLMTKVSGQRVRVNERRACHRCVAVTSAETAESRVTVWVLDDCTVCHRHRRWLGDSGIGDRRQVDITHCPDILTASNRHRRLRVRQAWPGLHDAYLTARGICWAWFDTGDRFPSVKRRLIALLNGRDNCEDGEDCRLDEPEAHAALYPQVIALTAILASPAWRRLVTSRQPGDLERFLRRVATDVTDGYKPRGGTDPLRAWVSDAITEATIADRAL